MFCIRLIIAVNKSHVWDTFNTQKTARMALTSSCPFLWHNYILSQFHNFLVILNQCHQQAPVQQSTNASSTLAALTMNASTTKLKKNISVARQRYLLMTLGIVNLHHDKSPFPDYSIYIRLAVQIWEHEKAKMWTACVAQKAWRE